MGLIRWCVHKLCVCSLRSGRRAMFSQLPHNGQCTTISGGIYAPLCHYTSTTATALRPITPYDYTSTTATGLRPKLPADATFIASHCGIFTSTSATAADTACTVRAAALHRYATTSQSLMYIARGRCRRPGNTTRHSSTGSTRASSSNSACRTGNSNTCGSSSSSSRTGRTSAWRASCNGGRGGGGISCGNVSDGSRGGQSNSEHAKNSTSGCFDGGGASYPHQ